MRDERVSELAAGFSSVADVYERTRPTYPDAAIDWIVGKLGINPSSRLLDVGAGTGKLTRGFLKTRATLLAVEPLAELRATFEQILPSVRVLDGVAESLPIPDVSVDAIVVGQAFHWFDPEPTFQEFHRVLSPGGGIALLWNNEDASVEWVAELKEVHKKYREGTRSPGAWKRALNHSKYFTPYELAMFKHAWPLPLEEFLAEISTHSHIVALSAEERSKALREIEELLRRRGAVASNGIVEGPNYTDVYLSRRRD